MGISHFYIAVYLVFVQLQRFAAINAVVILVCLCVWYSRVTRIIKALEILALSRAKLCDGLIFFLRANGKHNNLIIIHNEQCLIFIRSYYMLNQQ